LRSRCIQIYTGDSVVFVWKGPDTDHSATADDGSFDTGTGPSLNDTYGVSFTKVGTFPFHCKVHAFMTGTITVQPSPTGTTTTSPAPVLSRVRVSPAKFARRTTVKFALDSPASVRATLRRGSKTVKKIDFNAHPGGNSHRLDFGKRLRPGNDMLRLVAVDPTSGKSSNAASVRVRITSASAKASAFDYPPITCGRITMKSRRYVVKTHGPSCTTAITGVKGFMAHRTSPRFFKCKSYGGDIPAYCVGSIPKYKRRYFFASKA
jgi:hypothetical protein